MTVGAFSKYVSGFTSDHTYQSATVSSETTDHKVISLTGLTWNLLNKCHSEAMVGFSNNPFDLDETDKSYIIRKKKQLKFLWKRIAKGHVDYMFLQEVDVFSDDLPVSRAFLRAMNRKGWKRVRSEEEDDLNQPMVTLYNAKKLEFKGKRAVCKAKSGKYTAMEAEFTYLKTGSPVCLTNMHLDYKTDHSEDILAYQQKQIARGIFTILGGDTNPHTNVVYHNLIGDENNFTTIEKEDEEPVRHDGFMASPASNEARVTIEERISTYFTWKPTNSLIKAFKEKRGKEVIAGKYKVTKVDPEKAHLGHTHYMSLPGMPWIRKAFEYLLSLGGGKAGA